MGGIVEDEFLAFYMNLQSLGNIQWAHLTSLIWKSNLVSNKFYSQCLCSIINIFTIIKAWGHKHDPKPWHSYLHLLTAREED